MNAPAGTSTSDPGIIRRLPTRLINQIAAGEVVVRPAAAVKELVENSLDAGATQIDIEVESDALSFTIADDGRGMTADDLPVAIERHATSKIRELDDLNRLTTRGFRGEALAAIAAISRLEIVTRARGAEGEDRAGEGLRLRTAGGDDPRIEPCAANPGTVIAVRDLFFNTPARLKFLKAEVAEWGRIAQTIVRQALTRPDVAFRVKYRGKPYLNLPANQPLAARLAEILPPGAGGDLLTVDHTLHEARAWGAVTGPNTTRRDRRHQYFFVNGRPISFRPLGFALEEAYRGLLMVQRYPMGAILIELPPETVDVNVHPTKEEVRFRNEALVTGTVHRAVLEALRAAELVPHLRVGGAGGALTMPGAMHAGAAQNARQSTAQAGAPSATSREAKPPFYGQRPQPAPAMASLGLTELGRAAELAAGRPDPAQQLDFVPGFGIEPHRPEAPAHDAASPANTAPGDTPSLATSPAREPADATARDEAQLIARLRRLHEPPRVLAQVGLTYIIADAGEEGMLMIDQHAAHEKILYLQIMRQAAERETRIEVQPLMVPHSIEAAIDENEALELLAPGLRAAGFEIEPFGGRTWIVQAVPVVFERLDVEAFLRDLIDDVGGGDLPRELTRLREKVCARAACRAAVMAGDRMSHPEMQRLVEELLDTAEALRCPHGRPTALILTREQLDRQFGRI